MNDDLARLIAALDADTGVETEAVSVSRDEIVYALKTDPEFFIEFFLASQLDMPVPEFHKEIWTQLTDQDKERVLLAIPRDHAKTTLSKLVVVWYFLFTDRRFCVYLSNTNPIAKAACMDIMGFMSQDNFKAVFGAIKIVKSSETESWWRFELVMRNGQTKQCILRGIGQGQQMRGINVDNQRPDIGVVDDVEDNENTDSEALQKKLDRWMFGPFLKAFARKRKILWLGNMLTKTSLLARLSRRPQWNPVVFGCIIKDSVTGELMPLWPGKWTLDQLREDFQEYCDLGLIESWMCEMMNMPGHGKNGFTADNIVYLPSMTPDAYQATFLTIDPAFGLSATNDETSISVHGVPLDGECARTIVTIAGRWDETEIFDRAYELAEYWNAMCWGIESVAAQRVLLGMFRLLLASRGVNRQFTFVPILSTRGDTKVARARALVALMKKGLWGVPEGDVLFTTELLAYNVNSKDNKDDSIDSVSYGPVMLNLYESLIYELAAGDGNIVVATPTTEKELVDV